MLSMQVVPKRKDKRLRLYESDLFLKTLQFMRAVAVEVMQRKSSGIFARFPLAKFAEYRSYDRRCHRRVFGD